ncbi:MAG UNVERIFIED_CONTAM: hypothetical protein LVT10_12890 [Anaerolineae bacterium]
MLHVGPPNSGKTYDALQALINAGAGWDLAPLRLLAFEVFDRLNKQGIFCNLLTGEERIDIPGATITAATIRVFNQQQWRLTSSLMRHKCWLILIVGGHGHAP